MLFLFVATHLINHTLGIISLDALKAGHEWFLGIWRSLPGGLLLYGALLTHIFLALWSIYQRRSFRLRAIEWAQLFLGLGIPILLIDHVLTTRLAFEIYGTSGSYNQLLAVFSTLR